jgi:hypothetical protein
MEFDLPRIEAVARLGLINRRAQANLRNLLRSDTPEQFGPKRRTLSRGRPHPGSSEAEHRPGSAALSFCPGFTFVGLDS